MIGLLVNSSGRDFFIKTILPALPFNGLIMANGVKLFHWEAVHTGGSINTAVKSSLPNYVRPFPVKSWLPVGPVNPAVIIDPPTPFFYILPCDAFDQIDARKVAKIYIWILKDHAWKHGNEL